MQKTKKTTKAGQLTFVTDFCDDGAQKWKDMLRKWNDRLLQQRLRTRCATHVWIVVKSRSLSDLSYTLAGRAVAA